MAITISTRPSTDFDLTLSIDIDILSSITGSSKPVGYDDKVKAVFNTYFKTQIPALCKDDPRFYVDYVHDGNKVDPNKRTKTGHKGSESTYMVLYAKNSYGFVINSWIVDVRMSAHKSVKDIENDVDVREVGRNEYLNSYEAFGQYLEIDRSTFEAMMKTFREIRVMCGTKFTSATTVNITGEANKRCKNGQQALDFIDKYRDTLYLKMSEAVDTVYYKGYKIIGSEEHCDITDVYDEPIKEDISMADAKTYIDTLTKGKQVSKVYGGTDIDIDYTEDDLFEFANTVIREVDNYIKDPDYWITWRDIHFEYDFEVLVMNVIDSEGSMLIAEVSIDDLNDFITDDQNYYVDAFVDQITEAYSELSY